jgi:hypothetical protein
MESQQLDLYNGITYEGGLFNVQFVCLIFLTGERLADSTTVFHHQFIFNALGAVKLSNLATRLISGVFQKRQRAYFFLADLEKSLHNTHITYKSPYLSAIEDNCCTYQLSAFLSAKSGTDELCLYLV